MRKKYFPIYGHIYIYIYIYIENEVIEKKLRYNNVLDISSPVDRKEFIYVFHKSTEINRLLQRYLTFNTKFHFYDFFKYPRI